jgi:phosphoribosyl 1,2-cyclic phosphodiesterase
MIFCNLGSGSKGNCSYIRNRQKALLIDQGFSLKSLLSRMEASGLDGDSVGAIILTHEHSDHLKGVGIFARRFQVPVYISEKTIRGINPEYLNKVKTKTFTAGDTLNIEDLSVKTFHIPHDATDPVGVVISAEQYKIAVVTDLGTVSESVLMQIGAPDLLFLESNHDLTMLINGPYPLDLKQRIKSRVGHLSNEQSLEFLQRLCPNGHLRYLILGHLSEVNNHPDIVRDFFEDNTDVTTRSYQIAVADQNRPTPVFDLSIINNQ